MRHHARFRGCERPILLYVMDNQRNLLLSLVYFQSVPIFLPSRGQKSQPIYVCTYLTYCSSQVHPHPRDTASHANRQQQNISNHLFLSNHPIIIIIINPPSKKPQQRRYIPIHFPVSPPLLNPYPTNHSQNSSDPPPQKTRCRQNPFLTSYPHEKFLPLCYMKPIAFPSRVMRFHVLGG